MKPSIEVAFAEHVYDLLKRAAEDVTVQNPGLQEPNYNQTLRDIAKRQAWVTAKEIGAISLPMAAGLGAGMGYEKFMKSRGRSPSPMAGKIMRYASLPAAALTTGLALRAAKDLKENEFRSIREEETAKYDQALREYNNSLQRRPEPEGLS